MNENPMNADEQFKLGLCYLEGIGVPKDGNKMVYWVTKAAEQNHAGAQFLLISLSGAMLPVPLKVTPKILMLFLLAAVMSWF